MEWGATNNSNQTSNQNNAISEASSEGKLISDIKGSSEARTAQKVIKVFLFRFPSFG